MARAVGGAVGLRGTWRAGVAGYCKEEGKGESEEESEEEDVDW